MSSVGHTFITFCAYYQMDLWTACEEGNLGRVRQLIQDGKDVNNTRSDKLGLTTPLMHAADKGHVLVVCELIRAGADVNMRDNTKQTAIHKASCSGHSSVVTTLIEAGANLDEQDANGVTPLMEAAYRGHHQVMLELIRGGIDVNDISSHWCYSIAAGSTALHFAAKWNRIECGILLVEAGAKMRTKNVDSKSPLNLASSHFRRSIQKASSFSSTQVVLVIGNAEHGKSTLIAALQAESTSLFQKFANRFTKVRDIRQRTAGIEEVQFTSRKYGETVFYDFAGQSNYHGPHQAFLQTMMCDPRVCMLILLLVKATDEEHVIMRNITSWLRPLSLASTPTTPYVILVGSFLDQVKSRKEATQKLWRCTQLVQEEFDFYIVGPCLLDCRKPESKGINQICSIFQDGEVISFDDSWAFSYSLHWVLVQLRRTFSVPAITLNTFQSWLLNDAKLVLRNFPSAEQICRDLAVVGHVVFLPKYKDPTQSWLILNLQAILHEVYGALFSGSQSKVNQFGLLHCSQLPELFPKFDPTMIQEVLTSLEFCIQIDSLFIREDLLKLIAEYEGNSWLYFPALVSAQPVEVFPSVSDPHQIQWMCWQWRTAEKHLISAHLLQTIILHLAANHVFTHKIFPSVREHCCCVWVNGLSWRSIKGVDIAVEINDSSVVQVVARSMEGSNKLHQYVSVIVKDIIKTATLISPNLEAASYIVHPYTPALWEDAKAPPLHSLYPISSIIRCISDGGDHIPSLQGKPRCLPDQRNLSQLFGGWSPSLSVIQDMDFIREVQPGECVFSLQATPPHIWGAVWIKTRWRDTL